MYTIATTAILILTPYLCLPMVAKSICQKRLKKAAGLLNPKMNMPAAENRYPLFEILKAISLVTIFFS